MLRQECLGNHRSYKLRKKKKHSTSHCYICVLHFVPDHLKGYQRQTTLHHFTLCFPLSTTLQLGLGAVLLPLDFVLLFKTSHLLQTQNPWDLQKMLIPTVLPMSPSLLISIFCLSYIIVTRSKTNPNNSFLIQLLSFVSLLSTVLQCDRHQKQIGQYVKSLK